VKQPKLRPVPAKGMFRLVDDYTIRSKGFEVCVPALFRFDGASIPPFGWRATYTPFHPRVLAPACVHDWLYCNHQTTREDADSIFYDLLLRNGADKEKARIMWKAVSAAGGPHWAHSKRDVYELTRLYRMIKWHANFHEYRFPVEVVEGDDP